MKLATSLSGFPIVVTIALGLAWGPLPSNLSAAELKNTPKTPVVAQRLFASPDEAVKALQQAAGAGDKAALVEIFGAEYREILTGDAVQDAKHAQRFAAALKQGCEPVKRREDMVVLEIGTNRWPMAIPLVQAEGKWRFDTAAGKEEVINRHIGKDELNAVGVCRAYVAAQRQFARVNQVPGESAKYARQFNSSPGKKDGLYWPASANEPASPFGPLVAEVHAEGYFSYREGSVPHPFHGYIFKILTRQGQAAPGGAMDYLSHGKLTEGFALVAYPERWGQSGIMTFIVNQDGKIYQRNWGEETSRRAGAMKEYNPESGWALVSEEGIVSAVSEK